MKSMAGIDMLHIPFKGSVPAISEVVSGRVSLSFAVMTPVISFVQSGRLRALGTASRARSLGYKEFPTIAESGLPGFEASGWNGICAPAGLPREVLTKLHGAIVDTFATEESRNKYIKWVSTCCRADFARGVFRVDTRRDSEMGEGDQGRRHQGGMSSGYSFVTSTKLARGAFARVRVA